MTSPVESRPSSNRLAWLPAGLIWLTFLGWSLLRIPIPGVNEPYYRGKAKHFWNPAWCSGDFFLASSNPHQVFYLTFGWPTQFLDLPQAAILGRAIGLLILAYGWQRLFHTISGNKWVGLLAVPVFLMLQSLGSFSGEWLVGGIESKVPAYGFLFWAVGNFLSRRYDSAGILAGLSIAFHPLVGIWGIAAGVVATGREILQRRTDSAHSRFEQGESALLPSFVTGTFMLGLCLLCSLPGLIPALEILQTSDPQADEIANQLQVGSRLSHHLDPMKFPKESYRYWGLLIAIWLILQSRLPQNSRQRWWQAFVITCILIAGVGILIGLGPRPVTAMPGHSWRLKLLKFYFFRLGDLIVPVAFSLTAVRASLAARAQAVENGGHPFHFSLCMVGLLAMTIGALCIPFPDANPSRLNRTQYANWVATCRWVKDHSKETDLIYTTSSGWAAKWFAQRAEYVNYKDMPQDSAAIVEWNRRLWVIADWRVASARDLQITSQELSELRKKTGVRYFICRTFGPMTVPAAYSNSTYRVYELPEE